MNMKMIHYLGHRKLLALLLMALLLSACTWPSQPPPTPAPGETELPFESIDRYDWAAQPYSNPQPAVVLVTSRQEIEERLDHWVRDSVLEALQDIDFGQYFALAVFRGRKPMGGYSVTIRRVARRGEQLVVYAELSESPPNFPKPTAASSPYHLVRVQWNGRSLEPRDVVLLTWVTYYQ
jgi:hypothetical protein